MLRWTKEWTRRVIKVHFQGWTIAGFIIGMVMVMCPEEVFLRSLRQSLNDTITAFNRKVTK